MIFLGRSHQERYEAEDTLTMISDGVEIPIAGGGVHENDQGNRGLFLFFIFLYDMFVDF